MFSSLFIIMSLFSIELLRSPPFNLSSMMKFSCVDDLECLMQGFCKKNSAGEKGKT